MKSKINVNKKSVFAGSFLFIFVLAGIVFNSAYADEFIIYQAEEISEQEFKEFIPYLPEKNKEKLNVVVGRQNELFNLINKTRTEKGLSEVYVNSKLQNTAYLMNINSYYFDETGLEEYENNGLSIMKSEGFMNTHQLVLEQHKINALPRDYEKFSHIFEEKIMKSELISMKDVQTMAVSVMKKDDSTYYLSLVYSYN